jgi:hypothetical protein
MSDPTVPPLQLGQILTMLSAEIRDLKRLVGDLRNDIARDRERSDIDRAELREFAKSVKTALHESASSESQEMRVARIDTPLPPAPRPTAPRHGKPR